MRSNCLAVIILFTGLASGACGKRVPVAPLPPPRATPVTAASAPSAPPIPPPKVSALDQANRAFNSGNYDEAGRGYENYLRSTSPEDSSRKDEALFYQALIYALRPAPGTDWQRAANTLKQLVDDYPESPFRAQANLILSLRAEADQGALDVKQRDLKIKQLTTELDRLKKIDADRRKRP